MDEVKPHSGSIWIGIDPGVSGAIAVVDATGRVVVMLDDMPTMKRSAAKNARSQVNAAALGAMLRPYASQAIAAIVERVNTMPGQGVASQGALMHSLGIIEGVLAALGIPTYLVTPASWKKQAGLIGADKEASRAMAQRLWPDLPLARKKDHGRAEALLLSSLRTGVF